MNYETALVLMERFLRGCHEERWAEVIKEHLSIWRKRRDASPNSALGGGMGSFDDVLPSDAKGEYSGWCNEYFQWMKAILFNCSTEPDREFSASEFKEMMRAAAPFAGQKWCSEVCGEQGGEAMLRSYLRGEMAATKVAVSRGLSINGVRCLACGYAEVKPILVDWFIAAAIMPDLIFRAIDNGTMDALQEDVLRSSSSEFRQLHAIVAPTLEQNGIKIVDRKSWMDVCPACGSSDTAGCNWEPVLGRENKFAPTKSSLPLKSKK